MTNWTLDNIPWARFDAARVDPDLLKLVRAAAMVESNGNDYAVYLCGVFGDDAQFQQVARDWAREEVQHGRALGRWAALADPSFDYAASLKRFTEGYRVPIALTQSVRGSRTGELVARCIVETGTSSYYTALMEATDEPVLKEICRHIAADELRHYKLFYTHLQRYLARERIGGWRRLLVALRRLWEAEGDDELPYAYYAANEWVLPYERAKYAREYSSRAYRYYRPSHVRRAVAMVLKAVGLRSNGWLNGALTWLACGLLRRRLEQDGFGLNKSKT